MKKLLILLFSAGLLTACGDGDVYTLYRAGVGMPNLRVHVALLTQMIQKLSNLKPTTKITAKQR